MLLLAPRDARAEKHLPITLLTVGINHAQEPLNRPFGSVYHHILYIEKGCGVLETKEGKFNMEEGTAIFIRANAPVNYYAKSKVFETAWITFLGNNVEKILEYFCVKNFTFLKSDTIYSKIAYVFKMVDRRKNAELLSKYVYDILITYFSELASAQKPPLLIKAKEYMEEHYGESISAADIAVSIGISESLLFKLFRVNEDVTPTEYLRSVRLQHAEQMLLSDATVRISDIASFCGFSDTAYFCKVFKDEIGMTPKNYQSKHMKLGDDFMDQNINRSIFERPKFLL